MNGKVLGHSLSRRWAFARLLSGLFWAGALLLLVVVLRTVPLGEAWAILQGLQGGEIAALVFMNLLVLMALNGRWWLIMRGQGYPIPFFTLLGYRQAAFAVTYFTPGPQFGGEPLQVLLVERKHGVPRTAAVAAVTLDKSLELLVNFLFLVAGVFVMLSQGLFGDALGGGMIVWPLLLMSLPLLFLVTTWAGWHPVTRFLRLFQRCSWFAASGRWAAQYGRLAEGLEATESRATELCRQSPGSLFLALLVSLLGWLLLIGEYWMMFSFLGLSLTAVQMILLLTAVRIAILLPLPGGLGSLEASQVLTLTLMNLEPAAGLSAALLIRLRDVFLGGLGAWWGGRTWRQVSS